MAAIYTERVQTILTKEQFNLLTAIGQEEKKAISVLIRAAIEDAYFA